jgi:monoterpene epsilon-lactone hydrolase
MPSLRAMFFNSATRLLVRRRWGLDEFELAKKARRVMGAPRVLQEICAIGLDVKPVKGQALRGEWITPKNAGPDGVVLYIHGGGFVSCSARTHRPITTALARKTGRRVFAVDYRLAPEHRFPAALDDVFAAYKWLVENGSNPGRIALAGDSAGGGLVLSLLLRIRDEGLNLPACAVCFSPWANLSPRGPECLNATRDAMFYPENVAEFAPAYRGDASASDPFVSPLFADYHGLPPVLFQVSSTEILLEDSTAIHNKILAAGGVSELEIFDDVSHCWQMLNWFVPEAGRALRQAADFILRNFHHRVRENTEYL